MRSEAVFVLAFLQGGSVLAAQAGAYGELSGIVRDAQILHVPEAVVTLTGSAVIGQLTVKTENDGSYRFRALSPGTYSLSVSFPPNGESARRSRPGRLRLCRMPRTKCIGSGGGSRGKERRCSSVPKPVKAATSGKRAPTA